MKSFKPILIMSTGDLKSVTYGLFGWRVEGGGVEESRVV